MVSMLIDIHRLVFTSDNAPQLPQAKHSLECSTILYSASSRYPIWKSEFHKAAAGARCTSFPSSCPYYLLSPILSTGF